MILFCRMNESSSLTARSKGKKRKIAETSNVITETLPSVEVEQVSMLAVHFYSQLDVLYLVVKAEYFPCSAGAD